MQTPEKKPATLEGEAGLVKPPDGVACDFRPV
jgi:hypothetical protein